MIIIFNARFVAQAQYQPPNNRSTYVEGQPQASTLTPNAYVMLYCAIACSLPGTVTAPKDSEKSSTCHIHPATSAFTGFHDFLACVQRQFQAPHYLQSL